MDVFIGTPSFFKVVARATDGNYDFTNCPTRRRDKPHEPYYIEDVVAALTVAKGSLTNAARMLGRTRRNLTVWIDKTPEMMEFSNDLRDGMLDRIEQNAFHQAAEGDGPMIRFLLQTLGKDRGYSVRNEQTGKDGAALVPADVSGAKEALKALLDKKSSE